MQIPTRKKPIWRAVHIGFKFHGILGRQICRQWTHQWVSMDTERKRRLCEAEEFGSLMLLCMTCPGGFMPWLISSHSTSVSVSHCKLLILGGSDVSAWVSLHDENELWWWYWQWMVIRQSWGRTGNPGHQFCYLPQFFYKTNFNKNKTANCYKLWRTFIFMPPFFIRYERMLTYIAVSEDVCAE